MAASSYTSVIKHLYCKLVITDIESVHQLEYVNNLFYDAIIRNDIASFFQHLQTYGIVASLFTDDYYYLTLVYDKNILFLKYLIHIYSFLFISYELRYAPHHYLIDNYGYIYSVHPYNNNCSISIFGYGYDEIKPDLILENNKFKPFFTEFNVTASAKRFLDILYDFACRSIYDCDTHRFLLTNKYISVNGVERQNCFAVNKDYIQNYNYSDRIFNVRMQAISLDIFSHEYSDEIQITKIISQPCITRKHLDWLLSVYMNQYDMLPSFLIAHGATVYQDRDSLCKLIIIRLSNL